MFNKSQGIVLKQQSDHKPGLRNLPPNNVLEGLYLTPAFTLVPIHPAFLLLILDADISVFY
jgi:hypothetical protein